jgi:hypothetical protein
LLLVRSTRPRPSHSSPLLSPPLAACSWHEQCDLDLTHPILIPSSSHPHPILIPSSSHPHPILIPSSSSSHPHPILIPSSSHPHPSHLLSSSRFMLQVRAVRPHLVAHERQQRRQIAGGHASRRAAQHTTARPFGDRSRGVRALRPSKAVASRQCTRVPRYRRRVGRRRRNSHHPCDCPST